jgi:hypothetical protein
VKPSKRQIADRIASALVGVVKGEPGGTESLQAALAAYDEALFSRKDDGPPSTSEDDAPPEKTAEHVDGSAPAQFIYGGNVYVPNGARYIAATASRSAKYATLTDPKKTPQTLALMARAARFPSGPAFNFNPKLPFDGGKKANQRYPYRFQGHHLIPTEVYRDKKVWPEEVLGIRAPTPYDINQGRNVILLPAKPEMIDVHGLPCHFSNHAAYTGQVEEAMTTVVDELKALIDKKEHPKNVSQALKDRLGEVEDLAWDLVCEIGKGLQRDGAQTTAARTPLAGGEGRLV